MNSELEEEVDRLSEKGLLSLGYGEAELERLAALTLRLGRLKKERQAVIAAHVYQRPEVIHGAADFIGDSYKLAKDCAGVAARRIVFCGVRFMAETAKILNPEKEVFLPAPEAGCSLAESISSAEVRRLKAEHPGAPVVCYINTTAEVKAECDCVVTSANASKILKRLFAGHKKIVFLPDEWMGRNLASELGRKIGRELVVWKGRCIVHENFDASSVRLYRRTYPGVKILAHAECSPALVKLADFVGGTGGMMRYIRRTSAPHYMLVTECGLGDYARGEMPEKAFIPMCRLCPYMKMTSLSSVLQTLEAPRPAQRVEVKPEIAAKARKALERMFELAE
ncbi:MAG: quinolinate synthase NadA [Elusimicrobia bacterium]|nr:quinolinate synthase NadA [Elusimicrobiota bacterium]